MIHVAITLAVVGFNILGWSAFMLIDGVVPPNLGTMVAVGTGLCMASFGIFIVKAVSDE